MIRFIQFSDTKSDGWKPYTEEQLARNALQSQPKFETVLTVDQNPEDLLEKGIDPVTTVKYLGPMYLDFDDANDIDRVLHEVREVLDYLMNKLDIPEQYINCWLSGGKGVHITVPSEIFGISKATKFLPLVYREIMLSINEGAGLRIDSSVDKSVYSLGRGRMWRCEGWPRPDKGTYKVAVTVEELQDMDADQYQVLVASARPKAEQLTPPKDVSVLKCVELCKKAKQTATKKVRVMSEACTVPKESLRLWEGIPGCVHKLITEGDHENSNYNQGAMQLASYIAARYEKEESEEYLHDLVEPFLENVESGSRNAGERRKHVMGQLQRAFSGQYKLAPGAFIATIGSRCGNCPICRPDLASGETAQDADIDESRLHQATKIMWDDSGYWKLAENGRRQLTSFTIWADCEIFSGEHDYHDGPRVELHVKIVDDAGNWFSEVIPENAWNSKKEFLNAFKGLGEAQTYCGDADLQYLLKAVMHFSRNSKSDKELDKMTRSPVCGMVMAERDGVLVPHYIEADAAVTNNSRSHYRFTGDREASPRLLEIDKPGPDDKDLAIAIKALCRVNEPLAIAQVLGWVAACHFKEHIQFEEPQFPLLNLNGNAGSGKTSLAMLVCHINGIDYGKVPFMNVEVGTLWPLTNFVTSSTTVPRLVEEVNPITCGASYQRVIGIFKASWNRAPLNRGTRRDGEMRNNSDRVQSPILFTSEQTVLSPAVRERTVEVTLKAKTRLDPRYKEAYMQALSHKHKLKYLGKALLTVAINMSPRKLMEIFHSKDALISPDVQDRPRWGYKTCLTGLHMIKHVMDEFRIDGKGEIEILEEALSTYLGGQVVSEGRGRVASEITKVLETFNTLAGYGVEDRERLKGGRHYWKQGSSLYLDLDSCHPMYLRYMRAIGEPPVIKYQKQLHDLIDGEIYHERIEQHPTRHGKVHVINLSKLEEQGIRFPNFEESLEPEEV